MNNILDFATKMLDLQGIEVVHSNVDNGIFTVFTKPTHIGDICPRGGRFTTVVHNVRVQCYKHLPI